MGGYALLWWDIFKNEYILSLEPDTERLLLYLFLLCILSFTLSYVSIFASFPISARLLRIRLWPLNIRVFFEFLPFLKHYGTTLYNRFSPFICKALSTPARVNLFAVFRSLPVR